MLEVEHNDKKSEYVAKLDKHQFIASFEAILTSIDENDNSNDMINQYDESFVNT